MIENLEGVKYEVFRKKKLTNKKHLLVNLFHKMNTNLNSNFELNNIMEELNQRKKDFNNISIRDRHENLGKTFEEETNNLYLRKKTNRKNK